MADDANIEVAARRIVWGKCINAGQSCVAPDYVLCTEAVKERLLEACKTNLKEFYGEVEDLTDIYLYYWFCCLFHIQIYTCITGSVVSSTYRYIPVLLVLLSLPHTDIYLYYWFFCLFHIHIYTCITGSVVSYIIPLLPVHGLLHVHTVCTYTCITSS